MAGKIVLDYLDNTREFFFDDDEKKIIINARPRITQDDIVLVRIKRITFEDEAPRKEAVENVLSSLRFPKVNFVYIVKGDKNHVSFYYGIVRNKVVDSIDKNDPDIRKIGESILKKSIEGNFRGSDVELLDCNSPELFSILNDLKSMRFVSDIGGVPGINSDETDNFQGVDRLIDTMLGDDFMFVVTAFNLGYQPLNEIETNVCRFYDCLSPLSKTSEQSSNSKGTSKSNGSSLSKTLNNGQSESETTQDGTSTNKSTSKSTTKEENKGSKTEGGSEGSSTSKSNSKQKGTSSSSSESSSTNQSDTVSVTNGKTFGVERSHMQARNWMKYADETLLERLDYGNGKGMFMTNISLFADDGLTMSKLENTITALFSGEKGNKVPLRKNYLNSHGDKAANLRALQIPIGYFVKPLSEDEMYMRTSLAQYCKNKIGHDGKLESVCYLGNWMSVRELGIIAGLPRKEVVGLSLREEVEFGLNYDSELVKKDSDRLFIGKLVQSGIVKDNVPIAVDKNALSKHVFVCGVTGSGKTVTCMTLLHRSKMPFLVIEPAKTEYRILANDDPNVLVFTLGRDDVAPFRLNPLEFLPSETISSHVDMVKASIEAAFDMEAAIPQIIEASLYECYREKGWDVVTNKNHRFDNPFDDGVYSFPTLSDLIRCTQKVVEKQGFDERLKNDYLGSVRARLQGLVIGSKGMMLDTPRSINFSKLIHKKVILELEEVKNGQEKSLIMGFVLSNLCEAIKSEFKANNGFKHITLVEEAHRLLSRYTPGDSLNKKNGVETFSDMLAEVRKYGECLVIADQIPSKMAPDVLKNTNTKIVHKIFAQDDKDAIGSTMSLSDEQKAFLSSLDKGRSIVFTQGWEKSMQVQMDIERDTTNEFADEKRLRNISLNFYIKNYRSGLFPEISCLDTMPSITLFDKILSNISDFANFKEMFAQAIKHKKGKSIHEFLKSFNNVSYAFNVNEAARYLMQNRLKSSDQEKYGLLCDFINDVVDGIMDFMTPEKLEKYNILFNNKTN